MTDIGLEKPIQSPNDKRDYKIIRLENGLEALLISDNECDKSAAAMNVHVGQLEDPAERQGIAHFLEHMLFQGTTKYPKVDEYMSFLSKNSGMYNAYTALMNTNYFLECTNDAFDEAVDRFSRFFYESLFAQESVDKELNAVNSEHEKNIQQDMWRLHQLFRHNCKKDNPMSKFGTGNLKTLKHPTIREDLLKFYNEFYSANLMKVVLYSNKKIEQLEEQAKQAFSSVPTNNKERKVYTEQPYVYDQENLGVVVKYVPVSNEDTIEFQWIVEYMDQYYESNPINYISSLLGHEGQNSLLSCLKEEGLALELSTYPWSMMKLYTLFACEITLTKKGLENTDLVMNRVFEYLQMLRKKGVQQWYFDELKMVRKLKFDNLDKKKGMNYVLKLGESMQLHKPRDILRADYMLEEFNPEKIQETINSLCPSNLRIVMKSRSYESECTLVEPIYESKYSLQKLTPEQLKLFENPTPYSGPAKLDLPPQNIYIPQNMEISAKDFENLPKYPQKIYEDDKTQIFYKQDNTFKTPKGYIGVNIFTSDNNILSSSRQHLLSSLWLDIFNDSFNELKYLASEAYVDSSLSLAKTHLELVVTGFNDSLEPFMNDYFKTLVNFDPAKFEELFKNKYAHQEQKLENFFLQTPYQQAFYYHQTTQRNTANFDPIETQQQLKNIKFADLLEFHNTWLKNVRFEWLITGNFVEEQAKKIAKDCQNYFYEQKQSKILPLDQVLRIGAISLNPKNILYFQRDIQKNESNSCIIVHFQHEKIFPRNKLLLDMASIFLHEPVFSDLRTQQQLGYIVMARSFDIRDVGGIGFLIQSDVKSPQFLVARLDEFLEKRIKYWAELTDDEFNTVKKSVKQNLLEKDTSLIQESSKYKIELDKHRYMFDRRQQLIELLESVQKNEVQNFLRCLIKDHRKRIEFHLVSSKHAEENQQLAEERNKKENIVRFQTTNLLTEKVNVGVYPDYEQSL